MKGWLPNKGGKDFVTAHNYFGPMKAAGVAFYDETAALPVRVKSALYKATATQKMALIWRIWVVTFPGGAASLVHECRQQLDYSPVRLTDRQPL